MEFPRGSPGLRAGPRAAGWGRSSNQQKICTLPRGGSVWPRWTCRVCSSGDTVVLTQQKWHGTHAEMVSHWYLDRQHPPTPRSPTPACWGSITGETGGRSSGSFPCAQGLTQGKDLHPPTLRRLKYGWGRRDTCRTLGPVHTCLLSWSDWWGGPWGLGAKTCYCGWMTWQTSGRSCPSEWLGKHQPWWH